MFWPTIVFGLICLAFVLSSTLQDEDWKTKPVVCFLATVLAFLLFIALWWAGYVFPHHIEVLP